MECSRLSDYLMFQVPSMRKNCHFDIVPGLISHPLYIIKTTLQIQQLQHRRLIFFKLGLRSKLENKGITISLANEWSEHQGNDDREWMEVHMLQ